MSTYEIRINDPGFHPTEVVITVTPDEKAANLVAEAMGSRYRLRLGLRIHCIDGGNRVEVNSPGLAYANLLQVEQERAERGKQANLEAARKLIAEAEAEEQKKKQTGQ